ncbi:hypothetical protein GEMRC1_006432 [Eukaryota sp. GEM-RC1]
MTRRCSLTSLLLHSLNVSQISPSELLATLPSPPDLQKLDMAYKELQREGVIKKEADKFVLTPFGALLLRVPLSFPAAKLAFYSCVLGLNEYGIIAACICDRKSPIKTPPTNPGLAYKSLLKFSGGTRSDVVAGVNAYLFWIRNRGFITENISDPADFLGEEPYFLSLFWLYELHDTVLQVRQELSNMALVQQPRRTEYNRHRVENFVTQGEEDDEEVEDYEDVDEQIDFMSLNLGSTSSSTFIETHDLPRCPLLASLQSLMGMSEVSIDDVPQNYHNNDLTVVDVTSQTNRAKFQNFDFFHELDFSDSSPIFDLPYLSINATTVDLSIMLQMLLVAVYPSNLLSSHPSRPRGYQSSRIIETVIARSGKSDLSPRNSIVVSNTACRSDEFLNLLQMFDHQLAKSCDIFVSPHRAGVDTVISEKFPSPASNSYTNFDPPFHLSPMINFLTNVRFAKSSQRIASYLRENTSTCINLDVLMLVVCLTSHTQLLFQICH